jgi:hypothetical protein
MLSRGRAVSAELKFTAICMIVNNAVPSSRRGGFNGFTSPGRHCHSTLPLTVIDRHPLKLYTLILLPLLPFSR